MLSFFKNLTRHKKEQSSMRNPSSLEDYLSIADTIPGWVDRDELSYKAQITKKLPDNPVIVEIGCILGRSTVVMAGTRKLIGNGTV